MLEELDDVVFQAIRGDANSVVLAQQLWPRVVQEIGGISSRSRASNTCAMPLILPVS